MQIPPPPPIGGPPVVGRLPPGWTAHAAPTGQPYFFNAITGESTYVRPGPQSGSPPPPPPAGFELSNATHEPVNGDTRTSNDGGSNVKKKRKEKPVEKLPIEGTPWLRVTTNQGNVFFTNTTSKESVWTVPDAIKDQVEDLLRLRDKGQNEEAGGQAESSNAAAAAAQLLKEKEEEMQKLREELEREREAGRKRKQSEFDEEEHIRQVAEEEEQEKQQKQAKKARMSISIERDSENGEVELDQQEDQDQNQEQGQDEKEELEEWEKEEMQGKAILEAEMSKPPPVASAEPSLSSEEAIALFKMMLAEKDINPMRPWDMELPKFINDTRYKGVKNLRERKDLFDEHCKHLIREKRAKKRNEGETKVNPATAYRALLVAEVTSTRTHWEDFRKKFKRDSRFRDYGRDDREKEKGFRNWLRDLGEIKRADAQKAQEKFIQMLEENHIPDNTNWAAVKGLVSTDPRYHSIESSSAREEAFNKYMDKRATSVTQSDTLDTEEAKRKAAEERKAKQAASIREREEKVKKEKAALDRAAARSRADAGRDESERAFKSLLIDAVRDHGALWSDMLPNLDQDPRFITSTFSLSEKRRMFDEHLSELYFKRRDAIEGLFIAHSPNLRSDFETVHSELCGNPAVMRMGMSKNGIKRLFEDWSRRRYAQARKDFDDLLAESNFVEYWGRLKQEALGKDEDRARGLLGNDDDGDENTNMEDAVDLKTMAAQIDMKELQAVLRHDKRYSIFDYDPDSRERWITEHIERLGKPKQTVHQHL
ncbi:MAG: hypothetical protein CYPHOPRED_001762 [Cyphobasidiales sp. Tagirdzhanova-0007]|nr:MAG: hypothetical protein CYPHOPRED_001762 [Cyphobasidiales sp. Tagirdzhanova-0007]